MAAESTTYGTHETIDKTTPAAGYASGEVIQLGDGRCGVVEGLKALTTGDPAAMRVAGVVEVAKTSGVVILDGDEVFWDRSAGTATPLRAMTGADFLMGVAVGDATSAATTVKVNLNVKPSYTIDLLADPTDTALVGTTMTLLSLPGYAKLNLTATSEAQKVDIMSIPSIPVGTPFILEGRIAPYVIGSDSTVDWSIGIANGTHASDADSITEAMFIHFNETLDIYVESRDGTTTVAATDSTVNAVDDTYFDFRIDARVQTDIQVYINGVNVLPSSVFKLNAATGPLKLLAHVEKTSGTATCELRVAKLALRAMDVTS